MRTASAATIALLATGQFYMAELYTITLSGGTVLRYSAASSAITYGGNTWSLTGLKFERGNTRTVLGLETDTFDLTVFHDPSATDCQVNGVSFPEFVRAGGLDGATLQLDRAFMPTWGVTTGGLVTWFYGLVSDTIPGRTRTKITVKDFTEKLAAPLPINVYQVGCLHTLYDAGCTLSKAAFAASVTTGGGSTASIIQSANGQSAGYFDLGFLLFSSGVNNGVKRAIKSFSGGAFTVSPPLPAAPTAGDTFTAYPGCDKAQATCTTKFSNIANFRGFPFIPVPETAH